MSGTGLPPLITAWQQRSGAVGAAGAAFDGDRVTWAGAVGLADAERGIAMTPATLHNVASVSKVATALVVHALADAGRLSLDDDAGLLLGSTVRNPRFPDVTVTPRLLLSHGSSLLDGPPVLDGYAAGDPTTSLGAWTRAYVADPRNWLHAPPGAAHRYSNAGYGLLGAIAEAVAGEPLRALSRRLLLEPAGLGESGWFLAEVRRDALARGYAREAELEPRLRHLLLPPAAAGAGAAGPWRPLAPYGFPTWPDGLLRTSALGLARLGRLLLGDGTLDGRRVVSSASVARMRRLAPGGGDHHGLGLRRFAPRLWGHLGHDPGVASGLWLDIDRGCGVALLSNSADWDLDPRGLLAAARRSG